jgi:hypothetical protein
VTLVERRRFFAKPNKVFLVRTESGREFRTGYLQKIKATH